MKWILSFIGIVCSLLGVLNLVFYQHVPPILDFRESLGVLLVGVVFMYIGREHLLSWLAYFFSGGDD